MLLAAARAETARQEPQTLSPTANASGPRIKSGVTEKGMSKVTSPLRGRGRCVSTG